MPWNRDEIVRLIAQKLSARGVASEDVAKHESYHRAALTEFEKHYNERFPEACLLGMGGSGVVLKMTSATSQETAGSYRERTIKCLKYPHPCVGILGDFSLRDVLDNEADKLSQVHHQHVMPLDETLEINLANYADVGPRDSAVPSYLMPYIESAELNEFLAAEDVTADQLVLLLRQAAEALAYIHDAGLIHLDLKPANILVAKTPGGHPQALVADFGFCKLIRTPSDSRTLVVGTDGYMAPRLLAAMARRSTTNENRVRDRVPRSELSPDFDLFSFGATILDACATFLNSEKSAERAIPSGVLRGLVFVALRCSGGDAAAMQQHHRYQEREQLVSKNAFRPEVAEAYRYRTAHELADDLQRLESKNRLAFVEPEIAETTGGAVCLPERSSAPLSSRVTQTIDSLIVRRLATVSQLALCSHVYPGAQHNRKEHVLGTYRTACRFLRQLVLDPSNPIGALILKPKQQRLAMLCALLHDMSHVPLMHEFEDSLPELGQRRFTTELLAGAWGGREYYDDLRRVADAWVVTVHEIGLILGSKDVPPDSYEGATGREAKARWEKDWERPEAQLIRGIVDGAIDADKVDYLQRDALHAGVRFGHGVEAERIETHITTAVEVSDAGRGGQLRVRCSMGVWRKGQAAAESLIGVRHSMYSQVYAHRTVRAARAMLNYVVWKWRLSERYKDADGLSVARSLFGFASGLGPGKYQKSQLFEPTRTTLAADLLPKPSDNLAYGDASVIRWMALVSNDESARQLAEALVARTLYKELFNFAPTEVPDFLKEAFPKKQGTHRGALTASQWLRFVEYLEGSLSAALSSGQSNFVVEKGVLPSVLVDVAVPKTMRAQAELRVVDDILGSAASWKRVSRLGNSVDCVVGLRVSSSPVYDAYGGQGEGLAPVVTRVFVRPDLAPDLRPRIERDTVISWLEAFKPHPDVEQ